MGSVLKIADGIRVIDTGYIREEFAAIYLVRQGNEIAIIETGTKHSIPNIQQALEKDGWESTSTYPLGGQYQRVVDAEQAMDDEGNIINLVGE